jgi:hypothetical protein
MVTTPTCTKKAPASQPVKSHKKSPKRNHIASIRITNGDLNKIKQMAYHMRIMKLRADFNLIYINSTPGNNAYAQYLFSHIREDGFQTNGILMVAKRQISHGNSVVLTNAKDTFLRRCIVCFLKDGEFTHASRLGMLMTVWAFLMQPDHNKCGYD